MRIACVIIPHLSVQIARNRDPNLEVTSLVIGGYAYEKGAVYDCSTEAIASGVKPGMLLREAAALCPDAVFLPSDEMLYERTFDSVLAHLDDFSPVVGVEDGRYAYLDISGVSDERALAEEIIDRIYASTSLSACVGVGSGRFFAYAAALMSQSGASEIIQPGRECLFIAPFGIDILPCSEQVKESLHLLGVHTVGQVSQFECGALGAQFGDEGALLYRISHGIDNRPLIPRWRPRTVDVSAELELPIGDYLWLLHTCQTILDKPLATLREQGRACKRLDITLNLTSGGTLEKSLPFKEATFSTTLVLNRLRVWLEAEQLPAAVLAMELSLWVTGESGRNLALWHECRGRKDLRSAVRELKAIMGFQPLKRVEFTDPDNVLPERRFRLTEIGD